MALSHLAGLGQCTYTNIVSGGKITNPSDLGDGLHTEERTCNEQGSVATNKERT